MERIEASAFSGLKLRRPGRLIIAFAADWCPFCQEFLPRLEARARELGAPIALADLTDLGSPLWERFEVEVVPTLVGFEEGTARWRIDGHLGVGLTESDLTDAARHWGRRNDT